VAAHCSVCRCARALGPQETAVGGVSLALPTKPGAPASAVGAHAERRRCFERCHHGSEGLRGRGWGQLAPAASVWPLQRQPTLARGPIAPRLRQSGWHDALQPWDSATPGAAGWAGRCTAAAAARQSGLPSAGSWRAPRGGTARARERARLQCDIPPPQLTRHSGLHGSCQGAACSRGVPGSRA
jgi:hypothetical protein